MTRNQKMTMSCWNFSEQEIVFSYLWLTSRVAGFPKESRQLNREKMRRHLNRLPNYHYISVEVRFENDLEKTT